MNEQVAEAQPENKQPPKAMVMKRQKYTNEEKREREEKELAELVEKNKQQATEPEATPEQEPEVTGEEKTFKKRYGDLRRHMQEKDKEVQGQIDALKKQLDEATKKEIKLPKSEQDIEAWAEQYPDVAAIVYFTDLESNDFGEEPSIPVLWISTDRRGTAPFGTVVYIHPDDQE